MRFEKCAFLIKDFNSVCVTGKMASGKNFICSKFEKDGWFCVDADLLVHEAIDEAAPIINETFGKIAQKKNIRILTNDGKIDRRELGKILFSSPELLKKQEDIVYPVITKMVAKIITEHKKVILNATVLYKTPELLDMCEAIVFVKSNFVTRFFRARHRDRLSFKQIFKRFHSQKNLKKMYEKANLPLFVVNN